MNFLVSLLLALFILAPPCWSSVTLTNGFWSTDLSTCGSSDWVEHVGDPASGPWYPFPCQDFDTGLGHYPTVDTYTVAPFTKTSWKYLSVESAADRSGGSGNNKGIRIRQGHTYQIDCDEDGKCRGGPAYNSSFPWISFSAKQDEFWLRWYFRVQVPTGGPGRVWYDTRAQKMIYFFTSYTAHPLFMWPQAGYASLGCLKDVAAIVLLQNQPHGVACCQNCGWKTAMGADYDTDGLWHMAELHLKKETAGCAHPDGAYIQTPACDNCNQDGVFQFWLDGTLRMDRHDIRYVHANDCHVGYANTGFTKFSIMGNGAYYLGGPEPAHNSIPWDIDDIAIANASYTGFVMQGGYPAIGPTSGGDKYPSSPQRSRTR